MSRKERRVNGRLYLVPSSRYISTKEGKKRVPSHIYLETKPFSCRVKALWKGWVPRMYRLGPGGGIMLVAFDFVSAMMGIAPLLHNTHTKANTIIRLTYPLLLLLLIVVSC